MKLSAGRALMWTGIMLGTILLLLLACRIFLPNSPVNALGIGAPQAPLETYHTITINGNLSDWDASTEFMEGDASKNLYITWDGNAIYIGFSGVVWDTEGDLFVYLDTGVGGTNTSIDWSGIHTLPFAADYVFAVDNDGYVNLRTYTVGVWVADQSWTGSKYIGWDDNPYTEISIPWVDVGSPVANLKILAFIQAENSNNVWASWPTPNLANNSGSQTFSHFYHFPNLIAGLKPNDSVLATHVIINEFVPKGIEWVELYNPTDNPVNMIGWYADDANCGAGLSRIGSVTIQPGAYYTINASAVGDNFDLSNDADFLVLCDASHNEIDRVTYGYLGGAPLSHYSTSAPVANNSTARTPNGTDTDSDAFDWNVAITPTKGETNSAAEVLLGSSLVINEIEYSSSTSRVEVFNPTSSPVIVTGWMFYDGDAAPTVMTSMEGVTIPAGGVFAFTYITGISNGDVCGLFTPAGVRVDQMSWNGQTLDPSTSAQRIPDGAGPNDGYNWLTSGGNVTLLNLSNTFGALNATPVGFKISKDAPSSAGKGDTIQYTIWVTNTSTYYAATGVVITDSLPVNTTWVSGGAYADGVVSFTTPATIASGVTSSVYFLVSIQEDYGNTVVNDDYGIRCNEVPFPVTGAPVSTDILPIDLIIDKQAPAYTQGGKDMLYTIIVHKIGILEATNVTITDTLPSGVTYVSDDSGANSTTFPSGKVVWDMGTIGAVTDMTFHLTVNVDGSVINGQQLTNAIEISTETPGDVLTNNTDQTITTVYTCTPVHNIQGAGHLSPMAGLLVQNACGVVTARRNNGFWLQDLDADNDDATSEGVYIYTYDAPTVSVGDYVFVSGTVKEYRPGSMGLTITEFDNPGRTVTVVSSGNPLPTPVVIGAGGRVPPVAIIDDDSSGDVESTGIFDPAYDGIDFFESLEGMLLQINDARVVGATNGYGEIAVVPDNGLGFGNFTARGGIYIQPADYNPERIILDDIIFSSPGVEVGDVFIASVVGVLDYSFNNFKLYHTTALPATTGDLAKEVTSITRSVYDITVASFNLENLDALDAQAKFDAHANQIVHHLLSPDIIGVQEIQDNNGETDDGTVAADQTFQRLIDAIQTVGGPLYSYRQIDPQNNMDGGAPGANIRVGFLFRTDRGLVFVDRPGAVYNTAVYVSWGATGMELNYSPGRIDPTNSAFTDSRKPLVAEFTFNGQKLFIVLNHLNSKGGDDALFGRYQPPVLYSEVQRIQQAQLVHDFVNSILSLDENARVIVLGDLNDFQFSIPLTTLKGTPAILISLIEALDANEQYTYNYDGNAQVLDHILATASLIQEGALSDVVHMNSEYPVSLRYTDHDPVLARFSIPRLWFLPIILNLLSP